MKKTVLSNRLLVHQLHSKHSITDEVLIITSYDYFLQKYDIGLLKRTYRQIILVPQAANDDLVMQETVSPLLDKFEKIHLVTNPQFDDRNRVIYELIVRKNKSIKIHTVYDFCENTLRKVYIPENINDSNPNIDKEITFRKRVRYPKKFIDISISLLLLLITFPIWLISYLIIKLQSPGTVFFFQERVGINNSSFDCIKFRSMGMDAEKNGASFSKKNDSRIFPYGTIMRLTRIDELPQIVNIFNRDISLIGPRPERQVFTETFDELIPYYNVRHNIKPGITGYAQVMYSYGAGVNDARHKLMYDLYYIKRWTLLLECEIIIRTVLVIFGRKGR